MAFLQIDTVLKTAELYLGETLEEGWQITYVPEAEHTVGIIGPDCAQVYSQLSDLLAAKEIAGRTIPHLVKWAARGLAGIGAAEAGAV